MEGLEGSRYGHNLLNGDDGPNYLVAPTAPEGYYNRARATVDGRGGRDKILSFSERSKLKGGDGRDKIQHSGGDAVRANGGAGDDQLALGILSSGGAGGPGDDSIFASGSRGGAGNDFLVGFDAIGHDGNDLLVGLTTGYSATVLLAGPGDDTIIPSKGENLVGHTSEQDATYHSSPPNAGKDVLSYVRSKVPIEVDLLAGMVSHGELEDQLVRGLSVVGTRFGDVMVGDSVDDGLSGGPGKDVLNGGDGNDVLNGGKDKDSADGGFGLDNCPRVETKTSCEDLDVPEPPLGPSGAKVSDLLRALRRQRLGVMPVMSNAGSSRMAPLWSGETGTAARVLDLAARY